MSQKEGHSLETVVEETALGPEVSVSQGSEVNTAHETEVKTSQGSEITEYQKQRETLSGRSTNKTKQVVVSIPSATKECIETKQKTTTDVNKSKSVVSFSINKTSEGNDYTRTPTVSKDQPTENIDTNKENVKYNGDTTYTEFSRSSTEVSIKLSKKTQSRPKSRSGLSKKDLDIFLPRKSFYSSHDKVLVDAGKQTDTIKEKKKPDWRSILRMHSMEELYPVKPKPEAEVKPAPVLLEESDEEDMTGLDNVETAMSTDGHTGPVKVRRKAKSKAVVAEKEEYKPLYDYLKYISEHPEEYTNMAKYSNKNSDYRHPNNIVRLGRLYRRYKGSSNIKNSMLLHAANGLKPLMSDTTPQRPPRAPGGGVKGEKTAGENTDAAVEETEIEKLRSKTEKWMRGLTTYQMIRARELALKDMGEEDVSVSRWWVAFKSCKYIRVPAHHVQHTDVEAQ